MSSIPSSDRFNESKFSKSSVSKKSVDSRNEAKKSKDDILNNLKKDLKTPTILRPDVESLMSQKQRSIDGKLLSALPKRYISSNRVPSLEDKNLSVAISSDVLLSATSNAHVQRLNDMWTSYWDDEAEASYYYNEVTGEATWIRPDIQ